MSKPYEPNKFIKAMLILDRLGEAHHSVKNEILNHLGLSDADFDEVVGWLTIRGSDADLAKAPPFFDTKR